MRSIKLPAFVALTGVLVVGMTSAHADDKSNKGRGKAHKAVNERLTEQKYRDSRGMYHRTLNAEWEIDPRTKKRVRVMNYSGGTFHRTIRHERYSGELRRLHDEWHDRYGYSLGTASLRDQHRRLHVELNRRNRALHMP